MFNYRLMMLIAGIVNIIIPFATIMSKGAIDDYQFTTIYFFLAMFNVIILTMQHWNISEKIIILVMPAIMLYSIVMHFHMLPYLLTLFGILYFSLAAFYLFALKIDRRLIYCWFTFAAIGTAWLLIAANPVRHNMAFTSNVTYYYFYSCPHELVRDWVSRLQMLMGLVQILFYFILRKAQNVNGLKKCDAANAT